MQGGKEAVDKECQSYFSSQVGCSENLHAFFCDYAGLTQAHVLTSPSLLTMGSGQMMFSSAFKRSRGSLS